MTTQEAWLWIVGIIAGVILILCFCSGFVVLVTDLNDTPVPTVSQYGW